jgi:hypothetical protein
MDILLLVFVFGLLPLLFITAHFKSPSFKGKKGEKAVRRIIKKRLDPTIYREFSDVTIPVGDGTTQIDHVYVSPFGIFVIETKNFSGWIFGHKDQAQWMQIIYKKKYKFQNPLRQNYKHIKSLESGLGLPINTFKSVVVFTGDCTFKTKMPGEICTRSNLIDYMRSFETRILSDGQISKICTQINSIKQAPTSRTHRDHVKNLRRNH